MYSRASGVAPLPASSAAAAQRLSRPAGGCLGSSLPPLAGRCSPRAQPTAAARPTTFKRSRRPDTAAKAAAGHDQQEPLELPPHLQPDDAEGQGSIELGERFHWDKRTTGVTDNWEAYYGRWTHYAPAALPSLEVMRSGCIRKSLKGGDPEDNTFTLNNCFEVGPDMTTQDGMAEGFRDYVSKREDGKMFFSFPFKYSAGRAFSLPDLSRFLWTGEKANVPETWERPYCAISKAMLVRPKASTWAGTPYVPAWELVMDVQGQNQEDLSAFTSTEMWLSDDEQELVKRGVLLGYNTVSGELAVLFRCHERRPEGSWVVDDVDAPFSFDEVAPTAAYSVSGTGQPMPGGAAPLPGVTALVSRLGLKGEASVLRLHRDPSIACGADGGGHRETWWRKVEVKDVWDPTTGDDRYLHLAFDDGVYLNIPKNLNLFKGQFVYEFGAYLNGNSSPAGGAATAVHRIMSVADRKEGGHFVYTYERFE